MKNYVIYEISTGRIVQSGRCQDEVFPTLGGDTTRVLETETIVDPNSWRVLDDQLDPLPPSPDPSYVFDYTNGVWKDPRSLEQARIDAWTRVKAGRDIAASQGFDWDGFKIQADTRSLTNLNTVASSYASISSAPGTMIDWTTADNQTIKVTPVQLKEIAAKAGFFVEGLHNQAQEKRQTIEQSTSFEFLDSVTF